MYLLTVGLAVPVSGMTELETLRERCAQQDRQIRRLKAEIERLREGKTDAPATGSRSTTRDPDSPKAAKATTPKTDTKADTKADSSAKSSTAKSAKASTSGGSGGGTYTVRQGDSFDRIAHKNGTTAEKVAEANNMELTTMIHPGQKLVLPPRGSSKSSSSRSTARTADSKPAKSTSAEDPKPAKSLTQTDPKPADPKPATPSAEASDDPSVADDPPPAVPKSAASATAGRSATRKPPADIGIPADPPATTKSADKKKTHAVKIDIEMTYSEFAAKHGTDTKRLNDLNGLNLTKSAVLAKGSELYVPGQP